MLHARQTTRTRPAHSCHGCIAGGCSTLIQWNKLCERRIRQHGWSVSVCSFATTSLLDSPSAMRSTCVLVNRRFLRHRIPVRDRRSSFCKFWDANFWCESPSEKCPDRNRTKSLTSSSSALPRKIPGFLCFDPLLIWVRESAQATIRRKSLAD